MAYWVIRGQGDQSGWKTNCSLQLYVTIHPYDHPDILSLDAGLTRATSPM